MNESDNSGTLARRRWGTKNIELARSGCQGGGTRVRGRAPDRRIRPRISLNTSPHMQVNVLVLSHCITRGQGLVTDTTSAPSDAHFSSPPTLRRRRTAITPFHIMTSIAFTSPLRPPGAVSGAPSPPAPPEQPPSTV
jgi:hypothetical protein